MSLNDETINDKNREIRRRGRGFTKQFASIDSAFTKSQVLLFSLVLDFVHFLKLFFLLNRMTGGSLFLIRLATLATNMTRILVREPKSSLEFLSNNLRLSDR